MIKVPVPSKNIKFGPKWVESTVWPGTWSRSMPGRFQSLWHGSNPLQGAVPGLVMEVQVGSTMSGRSQIIEKAPKRVENRWIGPKQRPNEYYGLSGPIRTTPEAKNGPKFDFLRKTAPGGPRWTSAAPLTPIGGVSCLVALWRACRSPDRRSSALQASRKNRV